MASLWEIHDTSNLRYNTELGQTLADSGSGPPVAASGAGWIRTGYVPYASNFNGSANCNAWTSVNASHYGTYAYLDFEWDGSSPTPVSPWRSLTFSCGGGAPVWCVQD